MFLKKDAGGINWLLVCLGNPGEKYEDTRHNVGFMVADEIGERQHAPIQKLKFRALTNIFTISGEKVLINGKSVFQRLVLDQGFYPDGIYTASTDEALEIDVKLSMAAGFNGARLHEKVFEPRFLYHCDRLGYLVWGEQGNWGMDPSAPDGLKNFLPEWMEAVERDFNHPAIIGWCPFNETWDYEGR